MAPATPYHIWLAVFTARLLPTRSFLFIAGAVRAWWEWRKIEPGSTEDLAIPAANPLQLTTALIFAVMFPATHAAAQ